MDAALRSCGCPERTAAHDQVVLHGRPVRSGQGSGPAVADTGRAAVASEEEAQLLQMREELGPGQVVGDHARAGCKRGLDVRLDRQTSFDGFLGEQPRGEQHAGVRGVGARSDGGDEHVARADVDAVAGLDAPRRGRPASWQKPLSAAGLENRLVNVLLTLPISMRSCGRFGPASEGATAARSSASDWL